MKITDLLSSKTILLNCVAKNKEDAIKKAIATIAKSGAIANIKEYTKGVFKREEESTTGVGDGIAIPHCKSKVVKKPALAALIIKNGVDYNSLDGEKVKLLFLIAAPDNKDNVHLDVLAKLSNMLMHPEFVNKLLKAKTSTQFLKAINDAEKEKDASSNKIISNKKGYDYLAVTACPTGIAHTFMAEEALIKAGKKLGHSIKVETNGQGGVKNKLTDEEIKNAKAIIVAADVGVDTERFASKKVLITSVSEAIKDSEALIKKADNAEIYKAKGKFIKTKEERNNQKGVWHEIYKHLMSGVSHMLPLVVGGGILIALAFFIDMCCGNKGSSEFGSINAAAKLFKTIGGFAFDLMMPILAGFIAFSISGRPGLVVGLVGGVASKIGGFNVLCWATQDKSLESVSAGFLGALIAGFLAGYIVKLLVKLTDRLPRSVEGMRSILIYPLVGTLLIGLSMFLLNVPFAYINIGFTKALNWLAEKKLIILLGALLAMMMATDFGGPINKAAYVFGVGLLSPTATAVEWELMAAVMLGGMVPPLAVALSIALFPKKYDKEDRKNGPVTAIMGAGFITEGVIPYAAKDPLRVIISCMIGSATGGAFSVLWGAQLMAPHGGIFVFPVINGVGFYILALIIGTAISTLLLGLFKKDVDNPELGKWKGIPLPDLNKLIKIKKK